MVEVEKIKETTALSGLRTTIVDLFHQQARQHYHFYICLAVSHHFYRLTSAIHFGKKVKCPPERLISLKEDF